MCPEYYRLYLALVAACRQVTSRDGDAAACCAIAAAAEKDSQARREAVQAMREHARTCAVCQVVEKEMRDE